MVLVTNWITKFPRLKNSKVACFNYKAEALDSRRGESVESESDQY